MQESDSTNNNQEVNLPSHSEELLKLRDIFAKHREDKKKWSKQQADLRSGHSVRYCQNLFSESKLITDSEVRAKIRIFDSNAPKLSLKRPKSILKRRATIEERVPRSQKRSKPLVDIEPIEFEEEEMSSSYGYHHAELEANGGATVNLSSINNYGTKISNYAPAVVENMKYPSNSIHPNYNVTMATLCNIGNTCYLNSVVYTLRFAPKFLHNLHHIVDDLTVISQKVGQARLKSSSLGRNIGGLVGQGARSWSSKDLTVLGTNGSTATNGCDTPKTKRQIAAEKLHELYHNLNRNETIENTDPFHADTFLHAIQDVNSIFEGNHQQDAHEFLMCVLDGIRETCQSLIKYASESSDLMANGTAAVTSPKPVEIVPQPVSTLKTSFFSRKSKKKVEKVKGLISKLPPDSPSKDSGNTDANSIQSINGLKNGGGTALTQLNEIDEMCGGGSPVGEKDSLSTATGADKEKIEENIRKLGYNFFTDDFEGVTVSTTKCLCCETITEQKETMIDIAVPISGLENMETMENPHLFFQNSCITREYFRGDNKYRCEQCSGYTEAIRSISFEVLPRLLIIQLKRFSGGMEKINSYIPTPLQLDCFCIQCCSLPVNKKLHSYRLYSVITHVGATMSVGHYIAYTCSLDYCTEYANCQKESLGKMQQQSNSNGGSSSAGAERGAEKNTGLIKKIIFTRNKASSSGDVTKNIKNNLNSVMTKLVNGGGDKITDKSSAAGSYQSATTCPGLNCCSIRAESVSLRHLGGGSNDGSLELNGSTDTSSDLHHHHGSHQRHSPNHTLYSSSRYRSEPIWYMCDDDKIRSMSQMEFVDLLSPNNKITVTPYLLFYARTNN